MFDYLEWSALQWCVDCSGLWLIGKKQLYSKYSNLISCLCRLLSRPLEEAHYSSKLPEAGPQAATVPLWKHFNNVSLMSGLYGGKCTPALSLLSRQSQFSICLVCLVDTEPSSRSSQGAFNELKPDLRLLLRNNKVLIVTAFCQQSSSAHACLNTLPLGSVSCANMFWKMVAKLL